VITPEDVRSLFGRLLEQIGDEGLRALVVDTWVEGCREGGWQDLDQLEDMPFTLLTDCHGINFIQHTAAVTAGALALGRAMVEYQDLPYTIDFDLLVAGGLLHDVGKLMEIEPDGKGGYRRSHAGRCARHPVSGAILAGRMGLSQEVINVIACHAKEGEGRPQRVETVLVHQADFATFDPLVMMAKGTLITEKVSQG